MPISDVQFLAWLKKPDAARTVLCEIAFAYESAGAMAEGTLYLSDRGYRTDSTQSPPNAVYPSRIKNAPDLERRFDVNALGGRGLVSVASMTLDNPDGGLDFMLDLIADGREARFYLGSPDWRREDFRLAFVAVTQTIRDTNAREIEVTFRDKSYLLDDSLVGDAIATGPNAGKPKPILLGRVKNFDLTPYLLDSSALTYYVNNFALDSSFGTSIFPTVRDSGVSLTDLDLFFMDSGTTTANAGTDTINHPAHGLEVADVVCFGGSGSLFAGLSPGTQYWVIAAGFTVDDFRLSLTKGGAAVDITGTAITGSWACDRRRFYCDASAATIELSSPPAGLVTVDIAAIDAGGFLGSATTPHRAFEYLLANHTQLEASEYDTASIDALDTAETSEGSLYGRAILDRVNVLELLDEIAKSTFSWYGWNAAGVLTVGRLDLANIDAAEAVADITAGKLLAHPSCEQLRLLHGKVTLDARRNVVTQADGLASSVSAEDRTRWAQPFQTRVSSTDPGTDTYLANWWDYHKSAIDSRPVETVLDSGGQTACDAITALFRPWTRVIRLSVGLEFYSLNPGDCVRLVYPRWGMDAGKNCRVAGVKTRLSNQAVDLVLVTQVRPAYLTGDYQAAG